MLSLIDLYRNKGSYSRHDADIETFLDTQAVSSLSGGSIFLTSKLVPKEKVLQLNAVNLTAQPNPANFVVRLTLFLAGPAPGATITIAQNLHTLAGPLGAASTIKLFPRKPRTFIVPEGFSVIAQFNFNGAAAPNTGRMLILGLLYPLSNFNRKLISTRDQL